MNAPVHLKQMVRQTINKHRRRIEKMESEIMTIATEVDELELLLTEIKWVQGQANVEGA